MRRVDVVIPCYNYAHYLEYCVSTVLSQRDVETRILIVDDKSPDNTPEVAQRLVQAHDNISYTRNENNLGLVGTINRGVIDWAASPYTLVLSADDALTPGALARAVDFFEQHPDTALVYGMAVVFSEAEDQVLAADETQYESREITGGHFIKDVCAGKNGVASPAVVVRTEIQHKVGGYDPRFPHTCDLEMWMRFATVGKIGVLKSRQAYYRWHANNMSSAYVKRPLNDLNALLATCDHIRKDWAQHMPEMDGWIAGQRRAYASEAYWLAGLAIERNDPEIVADCVAFARQQDPDQVGNRSWWVYAAKKLAGPAVIGAVRKLANAPLKPPPTFTSGDVFGRWPG